MTDEHYVLGENEDDDTEKTSHNVTSPDISRSVETIVDDSNQVLCARECSIGNSTFVENVAIEYDIGNCLNRSVDDFTTCQILQKHWKPATGFELPFSVHHKKTSGRETLSKAVSSGSVPWVVFSRSKQGSFCKYCPLFVTGTVGGYRKLFHFNSL